MAWSNSRPSPAWALRCASISPPRARAAVSSAVGVGAHFLQAEGRAVPPLRSKNDAVYGLLVSAGVDGELFVSRSAALTLSLRAVALTPKQGVELLENRAELALPLLHAAAGGVVGL